MGAKKTFSAGMTQGARASAGGAPPIETPARPASRRRSHEQPIHHVKEPQKPSGPSGGCKEHLENIS